MTQLQQFTQLLTNVLEKMNLWESNAKNIVELPEQTTLVPTSKIHVSNSGTSESLELQLLIEAISNANYAQILSIGEITVDGNEITIPAGAVWKISDVTYSTASDTVINIPLATTGNTRKDIVIANTSGAIVLEQGFETAGIAVRPNIPPNTVLITEINVDDAEISPPTEPITGSNFVSKLERQKVIISENVSSFTMIDERHFVEFINESQGIFNYFILGSTYISGQNHPFRIRNNTPNPIQLSHLAASGFDYAGETLLFFQNEQPFTLKPKEIIEFVYDTDNNRFEYFGVISSVPTLGNDIIVTSASQIVNQELVSDKRYIIQTSEPLKDIIVPAGGLILVGYGFNVTTIFCSDVDAVIFKSPVGGSGNINLIDLAVTSTGIGSKVFDLVDLNGTHEVAFEGVNFSGCKSLGKIRNYRQGTSNNVGIYGCSDGLQFSGTWNGFKITNTNVFGFSSLGTLFKKDTDTTFSNRFFANINVDFPTGSKLADFVESNFSANELFQINSSIVKVNGAINADIANTIIPNLSANNTKCLWIGNIGLPDTAQENFVDNNNVSGTFEIDWLKDTYDLVLTGNTTFTEKNLPASGKNTGEIKIYLTGPFIPTFPSSWLTNAVGTYKGADLNEITLKFLKTGKYFMKINNSLTIYPKPSLQSLAPTSLLPSTTASLTINGSFFTPETIVSIENQTVNSVEFVNQGQLILSVTSSAVEEEVDITISNGTSVVFSGVLTINLGVIFIPTEPDWTTVAGNLNTSESGNAKIATYNSGSESRWNKAFDVAKDIIFQFRVKKTPLGAPVASFLSWQFTLVKASDNSPVLYFGFYENSGNMRIAIYTVTDSVATAATGVTVSDFWDNQDFKYELRCINNLMYLYIDNVLKLSLGHSFSDNLKLNLNLSTYDMLNIKYIELP